MADKIDLNEPQWFDSLGEEAQLALENAEDPRALTEYLARAVELVTEVCEELPEDSAATAHLDELAHFLEALRSALSDQGNTELKLVLQPRKGKRVPWKGHRKAVGLGFHAALKLEQAIAEGQRSKPAMYAVTQATGLSKKTVNKWRAKCRSALDRMAGTPKP